MLTLELAQPRTGLAWQSLYSICHIPRRKNKRQGTEAAITALLAGEGTEEEPIPTATRKV
jgi:hypothetical protein